MGKEQPLTIVGTARLDSRTKRLVTRLRKGDIAIIDHRDIDAVAARSLVECRVAAVVNAAESISGAYPNTGPMILIDANVPVVDGLGPRLFEVVREGEPVRIRGDEVYTNSAFVGRGKLLTRAAVREGMEVGQGNLDSALDSFVENTLRYLTKEKAILFDTSRVPPLRTRIAGRHALVVARGENYKQDLQYLSLYLRSLRPVFIGVDGGADAMMEMGIRPDIIVGDMDSVSERALRCGAELVPQAYPDGGRESPGIRRLKDLGLPHVVFATPGTSEDAALLLAYEHAAELIITVGSHYGLVDFLSKGRKGMASTFLVRLKIGHRLVDARGASNLYRPGLEFRHWAILVAAGATLFGIVLRFAPGLQDYIRAKLTTLF
jgi:uncharacterized membrane-anchored protein